SGRRGGSERRFGAPEKRRAALQQARLVARRRAGACRPALLLHLRPKPAVSRAGVAQAREPDCRLCRRLDGGWGGLANRAAPPTAPPPAPSPCWGPRGGCRGTPPGRPPPPPRLVSGRGGLESSAPRPRVCPRNGVCPRRAAAPPPVQSPRSRWAPRSRALPPPP